MFHRGFLDELITLSDQQQMLLSQHKWIVHLKVTVSKLSCMLNVLNLAHTCQAQLILLTLLLQSLCNMPVNLLSLLYCLVLTNVTHDQSIHIVWEYVLHTPRNQRQVLSAMNRTESQVILITFHLWLLQVSRCFCYCSLETLVWLLLMVLW